MRGCTTLKTRVVPQGKAERREKERKTVASRLGLWGTHPMTDETQAKGGLLKHEPMTNHIKTYKEVNPYLRLNLY